MGDVPFVTGVGTYHLALERLMWGYFEQDTTRLPYIYNAVFIGAAVLIHMYLWKVIRYTAIFLWEELKTNLKEAEEKEKRAMENEDKNDRE